ncbi:hypothetical protein N8134_05135 [Flavobacteriales bacterium]|nr:hypothetical protein [Flavobacteriales bacterium]
MNKQPIYRKNAAYKKFAKVQSALRRIALESGLFDGALDKPSIDSAGNATVERTTQ